jgi:CheY-like chemotaxis protein
VLLDLTMPRMGGEETLGALRLFAPLLPVLVSSGYEGSELSSRLQALHVSGFIQKPYQLADLKRKIESVLASLRE